MESNKTKGKEDLEKSKEIDVCERKRETYSKS